MSKNKINFELDSDGLVEFLKSKQMEAYAFNIANEKANAIGSDKYKARTFMGHDRIHSVVRTRGQKGYEDNKKNNTLLRTMGGM